MHSNIGRVEAISYLGRLYCAKGDVSSSTDEAGTDSGRVSDGLWRIISPSASSSGSSIYSADRFQSCKCHDSWLQSLRAVVLHPCEILYSHNAMQLKHGEKEL